MNTDTVLLVSFVISAVLVIIIPGPNVLAIVAASLAHGSRYGLQTVAGTSSAMAIQLIIAACATSWVVESLAGGFAWLRWLGVIYLVYLAVQHLRNFLLPVENELSPALSTSFGRGFAVSLTNPKTIVFFSAFLPQFVSSPEFYTPQIVMLSVIFLLLATVLDSIYALLAGKLMPYLKVRNANKYRHGVSGILYCILAAWLALIKRSEAV